MSFSTNSLEIGPFASYDIDVSKEDRLYRTALRYSLSDFIESMNFFILDNVRNILIGTYNSKGNIIEVKDVEIKFPQFTAEGKTFWMTPFMARQTGCSYMCDVVIYYTENSENLEPNQRSSMIHTKKIGSFHSLVGCCRDIASIKPPEYQSLDNWRATIGECPGSPGCYTINNGNEKTISMDQKLKTNIFVSFMTNDDNPVYETRITCLHKSVTSIVRMQIGRNLPNVKVLLPFLKGSHIPIYLTFYILYRGYALKNTSVKPFKVNDLDDGIVSFAPKEEGDRIKAYLVSSKRKFVNKFAEMYGSEVYSELKIVEYLNSKYLKHTKTTTTVTNFNMNYIIESVTKELFAQAITYQQKVVNLCYMACQTIRCAIGTRKLDSRDDLANQKVDSLIRMIASYCTDTLVNVIKGATTDDKGFNYGKSDRKEVIVESRKCVTLNECIAEMCKITNRVDTRTNSITLRQVSQDQLPNICPAKTPEGITCGLNKQKSALSHISDNREYSINRYLPIEDLLNHTIQYINDKSGDVFKYKVKININNKFEEIVHKWNMNLNEGSLYFSTRFLIFLNEMVEDKKVTYCIDGDTIFIKFDESLALYNFKVETFMNKNMVTKIPECLFEAFNKIATISSNPDWQLASSDVKTIDCYRTLCFIHNPSQEKFYVTSSKNNEKVHLYVSEFFISRFRKILGKNDKIDTTETEYIINTPDELVSGSSIHWSGLQFNYKVPKTCKSLFSMMLEIYNSYVSFKKYGGYSTPLSFNANVYLNRNNENFYPEILFFKGKETEEYLRKKRRLGYIPYDAFAYYDEKDNMIHYVDDPGRLMSPMLIVDSDGDLIIDKQDAWKEFTGLNYDEAKPLIRSLYNREMIEMIDAKEMDSTLLAIDINECRGISKLRKFLNSLDLVNLKSSIFKIKNSDFFKNEDITSVRINNDHYDIEFSTVRPDVDVLQFSQDGTTYYGYYVLKKKVATPLKRKVQKLVKPENGVIMDTYNMLYKTKGEFRFITKEMDPEFDGTNIYIYKNDRKVSYEVYYLDFSKSQEIYVDSTCAVVKVNKFTRPFPGQDRFLVVDGQVVDPNQLIDGYFFYKDGKYHIPDEYIFSEGMEEEVFDIETVKIHLPLLTSMTDVVRFIPEIHSNPNEQNYDSREARLYMGTIRRYIEDLSKIPDDFQNHDSFRILSALKENINEFGVKRQIAIIRKFLNTEFRFTHCLIDPNQAYSFIANFVPRGGSNPGPRLSYQCSMGVQALGVGNVIRYRRFETSVKSLIAPTEHAFETVAELPLNQVQMPVTQNFVYLVAANYKGFEDPVIISQAALEKFGRYEKEICVKVVESKNTNYTEIVTFPTNKNGDPKSGHVFRHLGTNGLPKLGSRIMVGDCIAGRTKFYTSVAVNHNDAIRTDSSFFAGVGTEGVVVAIHIISSENASAMFRTIIIKLAQRRKQQAGDKLAARYSQKGTIGDIIGGMINDGDPRLRIVDDCLMPYVAAGPNKGMRAEIIFNPASFPSRMTCGLIDEVLCSKASLYLQKKVDATSFHHLNRDFYRDALWSNSLFSEDEHLDINSSEILCHGDGEIIMDSSTGRPRQFYIGVVAYQFLKHHVADKETARFRGSVKQITHQPEEGRHNKGGQRMGEMERDAIISAGASGILFDRFMKASDGYVGIYCSKCKNDSSISNLKSKICSICHTVGTLCAVDEPRIYRVLRHQMSAIGLNIRETFKPVDDFDHDKMKANIAAVGDDSI